MKIIYSLLLSVLLFACSRNEPDTVTTHKDFCKSIHRDSTISLSAILDSISDLTKDKTGVYPF